MQFSQFRDHCGVKLLCVFHYSQNNESGEREAFFAEKLALIQLNAVFLTVS